VKAIRAFIVDDEFQSRNLLQKLLEQYLPEISLVGVASTVEKGLQGIRDLSPDIVFLDIQMNGETGFDLLNRLSDINFDLIFTTAFDNYAIKAFRFNAMDYLLKPIVPEELIEAVNKVKLKTAATQSASKKLFEQLQQDMLNPQKIHDRITIPTTEGYLVISIQDIVYCQADSNYTEFYLTNEKRIISSYTLKQYDEILTKLSFFRAHRSYLINMAHIKMYRKGEGGEIVMSNDHKIELSRAHKDEFMHLLNIKQ
jgi:two-component system LytT family response regulator